MRPETYGPQALERLLKRDKVATMSDMKKALGTTSQSTVVRKLNSLGYLTSSSHRGKYYTLETLSRFGTLMSTAEAFVTDSEGGYFVCELDKVLHVSTKKALQSLVLEERLSREKVSGWYVYFAPDAGTRKEQWRARNILEAELILAHGLRVPQVSADGLKAATVLVYSMLDEKQRRLCAGLESLRLGREGKRA